jgi:hypothetical protein
MIRIDGRIGLDVAKLIVLNTNKHTESLILNIVDRENQLLKPISGDSCMMPRQEFREQLFL